MILTVTSSRSAANAAICCASTCSGGTGVTCAPGPWGGPPTRTLGLSPGPTVQAAGSCGPQEYQLISTGTLLIWRPQPAADAPRAATRAPDPPSTARRV